MSRYRLLPTPAQQAVRDFAQAMAAFLDPANPARRPSWRKAGWDEGFRVVGRRGRQWDVRRLSRHVGQVWVPKAAFAAIPDPVSAPGNGQVVGIDRGVAVSAALSTGELLHAPGRCAVHELIA